MTDRTTEEAKREAFEAWYVEDGRRQGIELRDGISHLREGDHYGARRVALCAKWEGWQAALQWQAEQQKGEALPKIASEVRIMLGSATELFDGIGDIVGYQIKTGALHRILGLLSGAGHPVAIAAKNQSVALAASPHGVPPVAVQTDLEPEAFREHVEAVIACLGDDAASLRADNDEDERAFNMDAAAELLERLLSSLPQAPQGEQWRPIETAPKDGTPIIVSWPMRELDEDDAPTGPITSRSTLVTWMNGGCWIEPDYLGASGAWYGDADAFASEPDLWQPLPAPPATQGGADEQR